MKKQAVFIGDFPQANLLANRFKEYHFTVKQFYEVSLGLTALGSASTDLVITSTELAPEIVDEIVRLKTKPVLAMVGTAETDLNNLHNQERYAALGIKSVALLSPLLSLDAVVALCLKEMKS